MSHQATRLRDQAGLLAKTDVASALCVAESIDDPWFHAQALAWVSRYAPPEECRAIARKALDAAMRATDPYQTVGASAWALRALIETDHAHEARSMLAGILALVPKISHPGSQAEALHLLLDAVFPAGPRLWMPVAGELHRHAQATHWRTMRVLREAAFLLNATAPDDARRLAEAIAAPNKRTAALRRLESGESRSARPFFW